MLQLAKRNNWDTSPLGVGENHMAKNNELYSAMSVGERLRITRLAIGVTQRGFAFPLGVTREAQTQYESGARYPKWEHAVAICDAWGLTLDWIFRGDLSGLSPALVEKINRNLHKAKTRVI